jgi:hypothetical protein
MIGYLLGATMEIQVVCFAGVLLRAGIICSSLVVLVTKYGKLAYRAVIL